MNKIEKVEDVEASKAARLQRHQARYRDRGGIFKPAESNALLDILLSRDVTGKSPPKSRRPPRKSKATSKQRGSEVPARSVPSRKSRAPRKSTKKADIISVDDEATAVPEDLQDVKGKAGRKPRVKKTKAKTSLPPDESSSDMRAGQEKSFAAQLADAINNGQAKKPASKAKSRQGRRPPAPKPSTSRLPEETNATAVPQKAEIVLDDGDEDMVISLHIKSKRSGADAPGKSAPSHPNVPPSSSTTKSGRSTPALATSTARTTPQPDSQSDAGSSKEQKSAPRSKLKSGPSAPPARDLSPINEDDESDDPKPTREMEARASSVDVPLVQKATAKPPSRNEQKPKSKKRKQQDEDKDEAAKTVVKKRRKPSPVDDDDVVEVEAVKPTKKRAPAQAKGKGKGKASRTALSDVEEEDEEVVPLRKPRSTKKGKEVPKDVGGRDDGAQPEEKRVMKKAKGKKEAPVRAKDDEVDSDDGKPVKKKRPREPEVEHIGNARAGKKTKATKEIEEDEDDVPLAPVVKSKPESSTLRASKKVKVVKEAGEDEGDVPLVPAAKNKPESSTIRKEKDLTKIAKEMSKAPVVKPIPSPAKAVKPAPMAGKPASNRAKPSSRAKPPSRGPPPAVLKLLAANAKRNRAPVMETSEDDPIDFLS
ncbi:hypothetical protein EVG20_g2226 [Dentipellis fragilis]|uniref:Uncharacterized protein n=1 Tax=Dentipellis fragilis TaxID=205917 RepID=A0A4Y9ZBK2_9AGAM|nr:hypothetical protein EVG20_g2226 [Dentipellis fragilis]